MLHIATNHRHVLAGWTGTVSMLAGLAVDGATGNSGLGLLTNLGVAGLIVAAVLYMLRRSDQRDAERIKDLIRARDAAERRAREAEAELHSLTTRPPTARTRKDDR